MVARVSAPERFFLCAPATLVVVVVVVVVRSCTRLEHISLGLVHNQQQLFGTLQSGMKKRAWGIKTFRGATEPS